MKLKKYLFLLLAATLPLMYSCESGDNDITQNPITDPDSGYSLQGGIKGLYVLNQGTWGTQNSSLDTYNYSTNQYSLGKVSDVGATGNDMMIYGSKLYIAVNASNQVKIYNAYTLSLQKEIAIPNCRSLTYNNGKIYVTSYSGALDVTTRKGYVARIDTATYTTDSCSVGYQPEGMAVYNNKLYVANSGGYRSKLGYDNTVSVIDLSTFKLEKNIKVGINPNKMLISDEGEIFISSLGNYASTHPSKIFVLNPTTEGVDSINVACGSMSRCGDSIYVCSNYYIYSTEGYTKSYHIINTKTHAVVSNQIITDGTTLTFPAVIKVNPITHDIIIGDATDNTNAGEIYCFSKAGVLKWKYATGVSPVAMLFTGFTPK